MAYANVRCFVLKSTNYADADKILTLYSDKDGKISAIARGVRKISSRRSGSLDTLNLVFLNYYESSTGYRTITEVKHLKSFRHLKDSLVSTEAAYKIAGLVLKQVEEGAPDPKLFTALEKSLSLLDTGEVVPKAVLAYFYINFKGVLGYSLSLSRCVFCGKKLSKSWSSVWFNPDKGGLVCSDCKSFEQEISLRVAALLYKVKFLKASDYRFFKSETAELNKTLVILENYLIFKLSG